jgi:hypothetical protein
MADACGQRLTTSRKKGRNPNSDESPFPCPVTHLLKLTYRSRSFKSCELLNLVFIPEEINVIG